MPHYCLITDSYPPEVRSASVLMEELARQFHSDGHRVTVITTAPRYNLAQHAAPTPRVSVESGVTVIRVPSALLHNVGPLLKALGQVWLPLPIAARGMTLRPAIDGVIVYTPPLTLNLAGVRIARAHGAKLVLNVQDLFPQNAIDLGVLKNRTAIALFRQLERYGYRQADRIVVHSEGNRDWLAAAGWERKVSVIPNWFDFTPIRRQHGREALVELGLPNLFTVFFGGVMGYAQDLDVILDAAAQVKGNPAIQFLLVGDGVERANAEKRAATLGCDNVHFRAFVTPEAYRRILSSVDVGLVTLRASMNTPVVPNKLLSFLAAGLPVVTALNSVSDGRRIVEESGAGFNVPAGDGVALGEAVRSLASNSGLARDCGARGRSYGLSHFSVARAAADYARLLSRPAKPAADRNVPGVQSSAVGSKS
jgi:glycosyltransferase involved in cell wall biosynthesis